MLTTTTAQIFPANAARLTTSTTGYTEIARLTRLGLRSNPVSIPNDTVAAGVVYAVDPSPGRKVRKGSTVNLSVSSGPLETTTTEPPTTVPGMITIAVDLTGRLLEFRAVPPPLAPDEYCFPHVAAVSAAQSASKTTIVV